MDEFLVIPENVTRADRLVLEGLFRDVREGRDYECESDDGADGADEDETDRPDNAGTDDGPSRDAALLATLDALNDPSDSRFEPTVFTSVDYWDLVAPGQTDIGAPKDAASSASALDSASLHCAAATAAAAMAPTLAAPAAALALSATAAPKERGTLPTSASTGGLSPTSAWLHRWLLQPYIRFAQQHVVRYETDVVFFTHLLLYASTVVPSAAVLLFWRFHWLHGLVHTVAVLATCMGSYTIMMHQHIHQGGLLKRDRWLVAAADRLFPYLLDPLMGHTWNSYYYHHVKHHHVEANGPDDLSTTVRFRRDSLLHFGCYFARFFLLAWLDLPRYFASTRRYGAALRAGAWELASYALMSGLYLSARHGFGPVVDARAPLFVLVTPFAVLRLGLMLGNWGQHAFVDPDEPDSDFRSSITLLDVASNRICFNDGYHTSHHLNPRRHWRDHPRAFVRQKRAYAAERALVFCGIDYLEISLRLLLVQDYAYLARRLVPMGPAQQRLSLNGRAALLRRLTQPMSEADIARLYPKSRSAAAWRRKQGIAQE